MTCIVGLVEDGTVYMGGDSSGVRGWSMRQRATPKVFKVNDLIMGGTGPSRMHQLLQFGLDVLPASGDMTHINDHTGHMVNVVASAVRHLFKENGFLETNNGVEEFDGAFLVGHAGRLFRIGKQFEVCSYFDTFDAVGSGEQCAIGALAAMDGIGMPPRERIDKALHIAQQFSMGVRGPFYIEELR